MVKFVIHWAFMVAAIGYLVQRGERFFWRALGWFTAGFVANAIYGILELGAALAGHNLDSLVLVPLTGGASKINIFGAIGGQNIYRVNALTGDPNHFGVMLVIPLLDADAALPAAAAWASPQVAARGRALVPSPHRHRHALAQRRLGLIVGALVLVLPYRRFFRTRQFLVPLGALAVIAARRALHAQALLLGAAAGTRLDPAGARRTPTSPSTASSARSCTCIRCSDSATTTSPSTTSS